MTINHDHYARFLDTKVLDETLEFHAKSNYTIHETTRHLSTLHHIPDRELNQLTGKEHQLNTLTTETDGDESSLYALGQDHHLMRNESCDHFCGRPLPFSIVRDLFAPALRRVGSNHKRGYPSAGALFPVEIFCINLHNRITNWPSDSMALHLLPVSRRLEAHSAEININQLENAITPQNSNIGAPGLALVYVIHLPKAIFKYRYRGYRHALMEAGSLYMLTDLRCKELNLQSRPWSAFTDHQITKLLDLNPTLFLPTCIQLIG